MKRHRKKQMYIIAILSMIITGLGIGFAAFSSTLNISSSATVTPNSDDFSVVFSSSEYAVTTNNQTGIVVNGIGSNGAQGGITGLYQKSATGMIGQFTKPGQALSLQFYVHNIGEYDAYLKSINIENINGTSYKKCTASSGTTDSLVQSACEGIVIHSIIGSDSYTIGTTNITGHKLEKGKAELILITIEYKANAARADGDFDVEFGDISLEYSTVS